MQHCGVALLLLLLVACQRTTAFPSLFSTASNNSFNNDDQSSGDRKTKVLNFLSLPDSQQCISNDKRRTGLCQNPYECRQLNGESSGQCALGFGVCCVFTASCGDTLPNGVGYFVSPGFPEPLTPGSREMVPECHLKIIKSAPEVSQIRLDMVHFTLGQPNRRTGVCEQDLFTLKAGNRSRQLRMCGHNTGQHFYFDVEDVKESAEIVIRLAKDHVSRFWEIKVTQVEFKDRAPPDCLQYFKKPKGVVKTMNFADNGRHLADQDYNICIRQDEGMCSIVYEPCDKNSFKIGPAMFFTPTAVNTPLNPNIPYQQPETAVLEGQAQTGIAEDDEIVGSGDGGFNLFPFFGGSRSERQISMRECDDRIVMPCDSEDLLPVDQKGPGVCDLLHCGTSFCSPSEGEIGGVGPAACKIESSTLPFNIAVHFGPGLREENPEDNLGMCLRYAQQPCS